MSGSKRGAHEAHLTPRSSPKMMKPLISESDRPATLSDGMSKSPTSTEMPSSAFTKKSLPLHVNLTHTPPKMPDEGEVVVPSDPGQIGTLTLIPCALPSGGFGWKGKRTVEVELLDVERGEERRKVEVVLSVDAVVVDSNEPTAQFDEPVTEADGGTEGYESDNETAPDGSSL